MFLSFLMTFQYMMPGIHLDVQLYDKSVHLSERSLDCLIQLLLLRKKILKVFRACGGGRSGLWYDFLFCSVNILRVTVLRPCFRFLSFKYYFKACVCGIKSYVNLKMEQ